MPRGHTMRVVVTLFSLFAAQLSAQSTPTAREIVKTGSEWVNGIAEPASGRFVVYSDEHALRIYNRQSHATATVPVKVAGAYWNVISISRSGRRVVFPVTDDGKGVAYLWALDLDTLTGIRSPTASHQRHSVLWRRIPRMAGRSRS